MMMDDIRDDIMDITLNQQLLTELTTTKTNYRKLPIWKQLHDQSNTEISQLQAKLESENKIVFKEIFNQPLGSYFLKQYLKSQHSADKIAFIHDVEIFKTVKDPKTQTELAIRIYNTFCSVGNPRENSGTSCLRLSEIVPKTPISSGEPNEDEQKYPSSKRSLATPITSSKDPNLNEFPRIESSTRLNTMDPPEIKLNRTSTLSVSRSLNMYRDPSFMTSKSNSIGVYGKILHRIENAILEDLIDSTLYDKAVNDIMKDLRLDVFPRFLKSPMFLMYLRCLTYEYNNKITISRFEPMRMLGRGAFGMVNACKKIDTGKIYAMKQIDKRRVQATASIKSVISERNFLAVIKSRFVTALKYALIDRNKIYLIMDLMTGGDLKYHLNREKMFDEMRTKYYAAQLLLGLEHLHSHNIIYRDLKLENILVDNFGKCKISDLGLAVTLSANEIRGYAGTPGYTAPEVVLTQYYTTIVDFFSLGVVIYRCLCGKKPFAKPKSGNTSRKGSVDERLRKSTVELDRNVVEMTPSFENSVFKPDVACLLRGLLQKNPNQRLGVNGFPEIRDHAWFDEIDFGLLEAGYLKAPFVPADDEIHTDQHSLMSSPPDDNKYVNTKITQEFEDSLTGIEFVSQIVLQKELVEVLEKVHDDRSKSRSVDDLELYAFPSPEEVDDNKQCLGKCLIL